MDCIESKDIDRVRIGHQDNIPQNVRSQYSVRLEIFNFTKYNIGFAERSGKKYHLNPHPLTSASGRSHKPGVYFGINEVADAEAKIDIRSLGTEDYLKDNPSIRLAVETYLESRGPYPFSTQQREFSQGIINTLETVSVKRLLDSKVLYHRDLDLLLCILPSDFNSSDVDSYIPDHPYSHRALTAYQIRDMSLELDKINENAKAFELPTASVSDNEVESVFIYAMKLIEGDELEYGKVYVRTPGQDGKPQITTLKAILDARQPPGLYVYTNRKSKRSSLTKRFELGRYTDPADFIQFGVFTSLADAETPNPVLMEQIKSKNRVKEMEFEEKKLQKEIERLNASNQLLESKHSHEVETLELKNRNLQYEHSAFERKVSVDNEKHQQTLEELKAKAEHAEKHARLVEIELKLTKQKLENEEKKEARENKTQNLKFTGDIMKAVGAILVNLVLLSKFVIEFFIKAPKVI